MAPISEGVVSRIQAIQDGSSFPKPTSAMIEEFYNFLLASLGAINRDLDTGDKKLREAYRARHKAVYNKSPPMSASRLSYEIIWGDSTDINKNIASYKKKYKFQ